VKSQRGAQYIGKGKSDYKDDSLPDCTNSNGLFESKTLSNGVKKRSKGTK